MHYAVGFDLDDRVRTAIGRLPAGVWSPAVDAAGDPRDNGEVAELTGLLRTGPDEDRLARGHEDHLPAGTAASRRPAFSVRAA
nr:hypothetical protein [Frankia sp. Cas4]